MKKINFKNIQDALSRSEMKSIRGGSGTGCSAVNKDCSGAYSSCPSSCTCTSITFNGNVAAKVCR